MNSDLKRKLMNNPMNSDKLLMNNMYDTFSNINNNNVYESDLLSGMGNEKTVRKEWIERYVENGKVKYKFNHELRSRGSKYEKTEERTVIFMPEFGLFMDSETKKHLGVELSKIT